MHTLTGLPHELKSADFDIDSAIGGSITLDDLCFTAIMAHISRHPKLWDLLDPRTRFNVSLAGCFSYKKIEYINTGCYVDIEIISMYYMEHVQSVHMHLPEKTPRLWWQRWGFALLKPCLWTRPLLHPRGVSMYQKCAVPWQLHWPGLTQVRGYLSPDDHPCLPISETTFNKKENLNTWKGNIVTYILIIRNI